MAVFERIRTHGHEEVLFLQDRKVALYAIIAIHDTTAGPALGGCRMWPYENEADALDDVLRLSMGMTYKNAAVRLPIGGGKAVIWGDPKTLKSPQLLERFGQFVDSLRGRYITAEDVGMGPDDMAAIRRRTRYVVGLRETSGDPAPATAYGVFVGIRTCLKRTFGDESFAGRTVALQGLGHVGTHLARRLHRAGARLIVTDVDPDRIQHVVNETGAHAVSPSEIYDVPCDVFSPCALGGILEGETVQRLQCQIIAGAANNQLATDDIADELAQRGILYAPDFIINAGGVINVYEELDPRGYNADRAYAKIDTIADRLNEVFDRAEAEAVRPHKAAMRGALTWLESLQTQQHQTAHR